MATIIDGKEISKKVREGIKEEVAELKKQGIEPCLAVVLVGDDPASKIYVRNKRIACENVGMASRIIGLSASTAEAELLSVIKTLNEDPAVHGILVQAPLPCHLNEEIVINNIDPAKDVDAFHSVNSGKVLTGNYSFLPCTPAGIIELLKHYDIEISGKNAVVVGRSNIVGKPAALMLLKENATVAVCHSRTDNLEHYTKNADILIVAVGIKHFITAEMVKPGAVVIDVGMNRDDGKLCGDVDYQNVEPVAAYITPVPGGVGPMTITMLLKNTITAAKNMLK